MDENTVKKIYNSLFQNLYVRETDIFLCGGTDKNRHIRDKLKKLLIKNSDITVFYPEELFDIFLNGKQYDLLTLENYLAINSDLIVVIPESYGSYAELGAFVNNAETLEKVIVLLNNRYKNADSFITKGPVRFVEKKNKDRVIYYNTQIDVLSDALLRYIRKKYWLRYFKRSKSVKSITGLYNFILLILYFYENVDKFELKNIIKIIYDESVSEEDKIFNGGYYNIIFEAAINRLINDKLIDICKKNNKDYYVLNNLGIKKVKTFRNKIHVSERDYIMNRIRIDSLREQYY